MNIDQLEVLAGLLNAVLHGLPHGGLHIKLLRGGGHAVELAICSARALKTRWVAFFVGFLDWGRRERQGSEFGQHQAGAIGHRAVVRRRRRGVELLLHGFYALKQFVHTLLVPDRLR